MENMEQLLTPEEAAQILRVKVTTVKTWLRQGKLGGQKFGRLWRIRREDLKELKELGVGYQYEGHAPGHIRDALADAFEAADKQREWWQTFKRPEDAYVLLGKLWNCTDIVPRMLREDIAQWVRNDDLMRGCTYAQAVRLLKEELDKELDFRSKG